MRETISDYALFSESAFDEKIIKEAVQTKELTLYDLASIVNYKK